MALTATSLAVAATAAATRFQVTSATGATVGGIMRVDDEYSIITAITGAFIDVRARGDRGGVAKAHNILSPVVFGLTTDLADFGTRETTPIPDGREDLLAIGANGVIAVPKKNTTYLIMKGSALASSTLADPAADQDGLEVTFIGGTDFAHVVTTTNAFDGTTGASTTFTSAAFAGSSVTLKAFKAKWFVKANNLFVIT